MNDDSTASRLSLLQKKLLAHRIDLWVISDPIQLYYFTELSLSCGKLLVTPHDSALFVDSRYLEKSQSSPFLRVQKESERTLLSWLTHALPKEKKKIHWAACSHLISYDLHHRWTERLQKWKKREAPNSTVLFLPRKSLIADLRKRKGPQEQERLKRAAAMNEKGMKKVCSLLREGITEREVARELELFWKEQGDFTPSFPAIVAFGRHSSMPHHSPCDAKLQRGDIALIDIGVTDQHYCSDMTRTFFFQEVPPPFSTIYSIVQQAQQKALDSCRPGIKTKQLDQIAREYIEKKGYGAYFSHALGHGIGLEIHEFPSLSSKGKGETLKEGMAITIEPGIYLPQKGGIRIEDSIIITKDGYENLNTFSKACTILE